MTGVSTQSIWTHLSDDLRRFIRRRVNDEHVADDLLQEAFVRIHGGIERLNDADRVAGWVYQIARNVIHDHYRRAGRIEGTLDDIDPVAEKPTSLEDLPCHPGQWMEELIFELPDDYRAAVQLCEVEGLTQQQLADRLGISLPAAKSRIQRGRAMLKGVLNQCCRFEFDRRGNLIDIDPRSDRSVCRNCDDGCD